MGRQDHRSSSPTHSSQDLVIDNNMKLEFVAPNLLTEPLQSFLRSTKIQSGIKLMVPMSLSFTILSSRLRLHSGSMKLKNKGIRCIEKPKKKNKNKKFDEAVSKKVQQQGFTQKKVC